MRPIISWQPWKKGRVIGGRRSAWRGQNAGSGSKSRQRVDEEPDAHDEAAVEEGEPTEGASARA